MCIMSRTGDVIPMSVVIGICGSDFCAMISDSRMVKDTPFGDKRGPWEYVNDDAQKIFKINNSVVVGVTGTFVGGEPINSAFASLASENIDNITVEDVREAIVQFIKSVMFEDLYFRRHMQLRNYLIGGRNKSGKFAFYTLHVNHSERKIDENEVLIPPGSHYAAISLPLSLSNEDKYYIDKLNRIINEADSTKEIISKAAKIVEDISKIDVTVGGPICVAKTE